VTTSLRQSTATVEIASSGIPMLLQRMYKAE
jgi:hypothetical protein